MFPGPWPWLTLFVQEAAAQSASRGRQRLKGVRSIVSADQPEGKDRFVGDPRIWVAVRLNLHRSVVGQIESGTICHRTRHPELRGERNEPMASPGPLSALDMQVTPAPAPNHSPGRRSLRNLRHRHCEGTLGPAEARGIRDLTPPPGSRGSASSVYLRGPWTGVDGAVLTVLPEEGLVAPQSELVP